MQIGIGTMLKGKINNRLLKVVKIENIKKWQNGKIEEYITLENVVQQKNEIKFIQVERKTFDRLLLEIV